MSWSRNCNGRGRKTYDRGHRLLAIRPDWKPDVSYVQQFEFPSEGSPIPIQESVVGPQEYAGVTYPGGATQLEILNYEDRARLIPQGGATEGLGGVVPSQAQAEQLIEDSGGTIQRIEDAHVPPNLHQYPHINYTTSNGVKGTLQIQGLDG